MQWMNIDLYAVRWAAGFSRRQAAEFAGVTVRTFKRWERAYRAPVAVARLFGYLGGDLGMVSGHWQGWRLVDDELIPPGVRSGYTSGDIISIWWMKQKKGLADDGRGQISNMSTLEVSSDNAYAVGNRLR